MNQSLLKVIQSNLLASLSYLAAQGFDTPSISELQIQQLCEFVELLEKWTRVVDLVSQQSGESMVLPHIIDSVAAYVVAQPVEYACCDVGSGAGLPGIVWAILRPELYLQLLEPRQRRVDFLREVRRILRLENVELVASRMNQIDGELFVDGLGQPALVVCRALGSEVDYLAFARRECPQGSRALILAGPNFTAPRELIEAGEPPDEILEYALLEGGPHRKLVSWTL